MKRQNRTKNLKNNPVFFKASRLSRLGGIARRIKSLLFERNEVKSRTISNMLIFLFILLLPTQLGKHFFLNFSYLSGVRIDYLAPVIYLTDVLAFLIIVLNIKKVVEFFRQKSIYIFIFLILINIIFSLEKSLTVYRTLKLFEFVSLFAVISKANISTKFTLITLTLSTLSEIVLSILQFANKHSIQGIFYLLGERYFTLSTPDIAKASLYGVEILRPYGTFSHPNSMAGFYLLIYFLVLTTEQFSRHLFLKYTMLFLSSALIFLSFSKISIGVYLLLNIVFLIKTKFFKQCAFCFSARIIVLVILGAIFISAQGDEASLEKRLTLLKDSFTIIIQHPFFGVGLGNYLIAQHQFVIKYPYFFLQPVHNIFMLFLAEAGIFLTGFFAYVLYIFFKKQWNNRIIEPLFYCLTVVLITGIFDHYWLTLQQNFLLLPLIFGLFYKAKSKSKI